MFSEFDRYLFKEGTHTKLYEKLGAFIKDNGVYFAVWAPNAKDVSVVGDFNSYEPYKDRLQKDENSGIWSGFVENAKKGDTYKFFIKTFKDEELYKADPFAKFSEKPPKSASIIWDTNFQPKYKRVNNSIDTPLNIYEVHLGSWKRKNGEYLTYKELATQLTKYVKQMGFTHIELMPIMEHPFEGSWGYQITGYFTPTSRYGTSDEFFEFVDIMHKNGIGVILDWVPSHFAVDGHGLINFDGTSLFEHSDNRLGYHPQWKSHIFNYQKGEVRSFLISSAHFWLDKYNVDGIRVDAVASMLYLDYAREEWIPNKYGENINLDAKHFLKTLNKSVHNSFDNVLMIAEESTSFNGVTKKIEDGGLGFDYKWNMGWMNDTLKYFKQDSYFRQFHHHEVAHMFYYAFSENYILPLSHDEVVHLKGSLIEKMKGDYDTKFANLRALFGFMMAFPGKKLLFMGGEFAQFREWSEKRELDWNLLDYPKHKGVSKLIKDLNKIYKKEKSLWKDKAENFNWINYKDYTRSIFSFIRKNEDESIIIVCNFSDCFYKDYIIGVRKEGKYKEIFNSDNKKYGGNHQTNIRLKTKKEKFLEFDNILSLKIPPLSVIYLKSRE